MSDEVEPEKTRDELKKEVAEFRSSSDLRWTADMRAIKRWHETTGKRLTWPDHADLVVYLLERLETAEAVLDRVRTQMAAPLPANCELDEYRLAGVETALHVTAYDDKYRQHPLHDPDV